MDKQKSGKGQTKLAGLRELARYLDLDEGERLPPEDSILAHCCYCRLSYIRLGTDCHDHLCPLYPYRPYRYDLDLDQGEAVLADLKECNVLLEVCFRLMDQMIPV